MQAHTHTHTLALEVGGERRGEERKGLVGSQRGYAGEGVERGEAIDKISQSV